MNVIASLNMTMSIWLYVCWNTWSLCSMCTFVWTHYNIGAGTVIYITSIPKGNIYIYPAGSWKFHIDHLFMWCTQAIYTQYMYSISKPKFWEWSHCTWDTRNMYIIYIIWSQQWSVVYVQNKVQAAKWKKIFKILVEQIYSKLSDYQLE